MQFFCIMWKVFYWYKFKNKYILAYNNTWLFYAKYYIWLFFTPLLLTFIWEFKGVTPRNKVNFQYALQALWNNFKANNIFISLTNNPPFAMAFRLYMRRNTERNYPCYFGITAILRIYCTNINSSFLYQNVLRRRNGRMLNLCMGCNYPCYKVL